MVFGHVGRRSASQRALLVTALCLTVALIAGQVSTAAQAATTSPSAEATAIYRDARALRTQTSGILGKYVNDFSDRFTSAELEQLRTLQTQSDARLLEVVNATRRVSSIASSGARVPRVAAAAATARAAQQRARAAEQTAFTNARPLVEPKLNLLERLDALNNYNAMMGKFDALGTRIDRLAKRRA